MRGRGWGDFEVRLPGVGRENCSRIGKKPPRFPSLGLPQISHYSSLFFLPYTIPTLYYPLTLSLSLYFAVVARLDEGPWYCGRLTLVTPWKHCTFRSLPISLPRVSQGTIGRPRVPLPPLVWRWWETVGGRPLRRIIYLRTLPGYLHRRIQASRPIGPCDSDLERLQTETG